MPMLITAVAMTPVYWTAMLRIVRKFSVSGNGNVAATQRMVSSAGMPPEGDLDIFHEGASDPSAIGRSRAAFPSRSM